MLSRRLVERKCDQCARAFMPARPMQAVCSPRCAAKKVKAQKATEKALDKKRRESLKTWSEWNAEAQQAFNAWVRVRDFGKPCICCGRMQPEGWLTGGEWDAGHYRSRGSAKHLRFDERNCHAQLKQCNRRAFDSSAYRRNLIDRIGLAAVEALESDQVPRKYTVPDLKEIRDRYRRLKREIEASRKVTLEPETA